MQKVLETVECPECAASVTVEANARSGEIVECGDCRIELEISSVEPLAVTLAPEVEEDWGE